MKLRLSLELHVTRHKPNKPEPEADHQPGGDNYDATERGDSEPEGTRIPAGFSIDPY